MNKNSKTDNIKTNFVFEIHVSNHRVLLNSLGSHITFVGRID